MTTTAAAAHPKASAPSEVKDFAEIATQYARDICAGKKPACKWVRLACERHLRDLERQGLPDFPYTWNPELTDGVGKTYRPAQRVCAFIELMPHVKGDWAAKRQLIRLVDWQVFFLASVFGWIHSVTGKRRFRKADLIVPRKNAKSTIAAGVGNYMFAADGEFGAEVYSGATSQKQAMEVFKPAQLMARLQEAFRVHYGVTIGAFNMAILATNSKMEPLIGKPGDGASPSCSIVDEYHEHATSELYDTMSTGMGARSQPLLLAITTAGSNIGGPCYAHQQELQKILEGAVRDAASERRFGIIYTIDQDDDWTDPAALWKANPNMGISIDADELVAAQAEAVRDARKQAVFKTKHLNIWVAAAAPWLNLEQLAKCGDAGRLEDFKGEVCWVGLDLASKNDIASAAWIFRREIDGRWHYYYFSRHWLPEAAVRRPENEQDRKSTRLNSSHTDISRMPSSA